MDLVSDEILIDSGQISPTYEAAYGTIEGFKLWDPDAWTNGHPFELYKRMREESPVMWLPGEKKQTLLKVMLLKEKKWLLKVN